MSKPVTLCDGRELKFGKMPKVTKMPGKSLFVRKPGEKQWRVFPIDPGDDQIIFDTIKQLQEGKTS